MKSNQRWWRSGGGRSDCHHETQVPHVAYLIYNQELLLQHRLAFGCNHDRRLLCPKDKDTLHGTMKKKQTNGKQNLNRKLSALQLLRFSWICKCGGKREKVNEFLIESIWKLNLQSLCLSRRLWLSGVISATCCSCWNVFFVKTQFTVVYIYTYEYS